MSKHTPGKWIVKEWQNRDKDGCVDISGLQIVAVNGEIETGIHSGCIEDATDSEEADIYLMAAAPELLDALKALLPYLEPYAPLHQIAIARAAIAKATGETK